MVNFFERLSGRIPQGKLVIAPEMMSSTQLRASFRFGVLDLHPALTKEEKEFIRTNWGNYIKEEEIETARMISYDNNGKPGIIATAEDKDSNMNPLLCTRKYWFRNINRHTVGDPSKKLLQKEVLVTASTESYKGRPISFSHSNIVNPDNRYEDHLYVDFASLGALCDIIANVRIYYKNIQDSVTVDLHSGALTVAGDKTPARIKLVKETAVQMIHKYGGRYSR